MRGVHFTASKLTHSLSGKGASTDCPRADYHQLCSDLEHAWTNGPPMTHFIKSLLKHM